MSSHERSAPRAPHPATRFVLVGAAILWGMVAVGRLVDADLSTVLWTDRDLWRAARVFQDWPTAGAEMNYGNGARVPGGAYLYVLAALQAVFGSAAAIHRSLLALEALAFAGVGWAIARRHGAVAGLVTAWLCFAPSDATRANVWLWNPSFIPLAVALSVVLLDVALRRPGWAWLGLWGFVAALGASAHATVAGWGLFTVVALIVQRPRWVASRGVALGVGALLPYLPYVVRELVQPTNAVVLRDQPPMSAFGGLARFRPRLASFQEVGEALVPGLPDAGALGLVLSFGAVGLLVCGLALAVRRGVPDDDLVGTVGLAGLLTFVYLAVDSTLNHEARYLIVLIVPFAVVAGRGAAILTGPGGLRGLLGAGTALGLAAAWPVADVARQWAVDDPSPLASLSAWEATLAQVEATTKLPPEALAGRLLVVSWDADAGSWQASKPMPMERSLQRRGQGFPGSLAPPCFALVRASASIPSPDRAVAALVDPEGPAYERLSVQDLAPNLRLERFTSPTGRCPTSASNRYVPTPREALALPLWAEMAPGEVRRLPSSEGEALVAIRTAPARGAPPSHQGAMLLLALRAVSGGLDVALESNQLRGEAYNGGWYDNASLRGAELVLERSDGPSVTVSLHPGTLGPRGVVTPISLHAAVLPGVYGVRLRGVLGTPGGDEHEAGPGWIEEPLEVEVGEVVVP